MTPEDFRAAGLDQQTPAQLDFLNRWLASRLPHLLSAPVPPAQASNLGGASPSPTPIEPPPAPTSGPLPTLAAASPSAASPGPTRAEIEAEVRAEIAREQVAKSRHLFGLPDFFDLGPSAREIPPAIEARIAGNFTGWKGNTTFTLDNGQVWKQRHEGSYYKRMQNPEVVISRESMGYFLTLKETGARIGVSRIK